jgi:DNA-binding CsgD family transcriptional regulator
MVPYTGECRVYRAEILRFHGDWSRAVDEADSAVAHLAGTADPRVYAFALYQRAELHRLRGEFAAAEDAYRESGRAGRQPQPGLALLRLAQGDRDAAAAAIRRALVETNERAQRARLLPAHIDIMLDCGDIDEASRACDELASIADQCGGLLATMADHARGAVHLAADNAAAALPHLRRACQAWHSAGAPLEAARVRVLIARACELLGDADGARLEIDAARAEFERLGATPDLTRLDATAGGRARTDHGLTPREHEVIALVATGRTNRAIAEELFISEKTVARHVANIFAKLGLSSRAAATAYVYEHHLLAGR